MMTQVLRINYNHCKDQFAMDYLSHKEALERCVLASMLYIDKVKQKLSNVHFEDRTLQQLWVSLDQLPYHENVVTQLGLDAYRRYLDETLEHVEWFLERRHQPKARVVYVSLFLDASWHLCVQFRSI